MYAIFGVDADRFTPTLERAYASLEPASRALVQARIARRGEDPGPWSGVLRIERADGDRRVLAVCSWSEEPPGGQPGDGILGTCCDVTLAVDLHRDRERLNRRQATILRAVGEGICGLDVKGRIVFTNPALLSLLRRAGESLDGRRLHDVIHRDPDGGEFQAAADCPYHASDERPARATDASVRRGDGT